MKKVKVEKVSKAYKMNEDTLYSAIGRGAIKCSIKGNDHYIKLGKKTKTSLENLKDIEKAKKEKIKSFKKQLRLKERIIAAKDEIIKAKDHELVTIKEVYNNLLHLYNESKLLEKKGEQPRPESKRPAPRIEVGFRLIAPGLFSERMQAFGFGIDEIKELIIRQIVEGRMDFTEEGLVIEEDFFSQFEKKSTYWDKRNS